MISVWNTVIMEYDKFKFLFLSGSFWLWFGFGFFAGMFGGLAIAGPGGAAVGCVGGAVAGGVVGGVAGHSGIDDAIDTTKTLIKIKLADL